MQEPGAPCFGDASPAEQELHRSTRLGGEAAD